jgi:hypothetical protein
MSWLTFAVSDEGLNFLIIGNEWFTLKFSYSQRGTGLTVIGEPILFRRLFAFPKSSRTTTLPPICRNEYTLSDSSGV